MTGFELYQKYYSKRDYSGNAADEYAQLLQSMFNQVGDALFPLLEKAEKDKKALGLKDETADEISADNIILL